MTEIIGAQTVSTTQLDFSLEEMAAQLREVAAQLREVARLDLDDPETLELAYLGLAYKVTTPIFTALATARPVLRSGRDE